MSQKKQLFDTAIIADIVYNRFSVRSGMSKWLHRRSVRWTQRERGGGEKAGSQKSRCRKEMHGMIFGLPKITQNSCTFIFGCLAVLRFCVSHVVFLFTDFHNISSHQQTIITSKLCATAACTPCKPHSTQTPYHPVHVDTFPSLLVHINSACV